MTSWIIQFFFDQKVEDFNFKGLLGIPTFHHSNTNNQFFL